VCILSDIIVIDIGNFPNALMNVCKCFVSEHFAATQANPSNSHLYFSSALTAFPSLSAEECPDLLNHFLLDRALE
jgi:hypothetical protein